MAELVAVFLFIGVVAYAVLGGADFGAGFWDLIAGGAKRGREPRHLIDVSLAPVWEANHTWLIYCLVVLWTGFPSAFAAITTTLYIPLVLALLGIVLRGAGFAFRKATVRTEEQRLYGAAFALSSILTPYCFGAIAGGLASGRVPTAGNGDAISSWVNPSSILGGVLAVLACSYLAATYLTVEALHRDDHKLYRYYRDRAMAAGAVTGAVSIAGIFVLQADSPRLFDRLSGPALPLVVLAAVGGLVGLALLWARRTVGTRVAAAGAVALVVIGWGVAQTPYLLGTHLSITEAAAPNATLAVVVGVAIVAGLLIVPSLVLLFRLSGRGVVGVGERPFRGGVTEGERGSGEGMTEGDRSAASKAGRSGTGKAGRGAGAALTKGTRSAGARSDRTPAVPLDPTAVQSAPRHRWVPYALCAGAVTATAVAGARATRPDARWYRELNTPDWQPPPWAFGAVWTPLYASVAVAGGRALNAARGPERKALAGEFAANLALNAGWSNLFFRLRSPLAGLAGTLLLDASNIRLLARVARTDRKAAATLLPYAAWCAYATCLNASIVARNHEPRHRGPAKS
ncbi:cytochrome d ubiquinol oxidase subunit II [Streptomyces sp. NBC_01171]|uniref:cytochrome d ubiquinol oxidase subunit II n=1 Tax=Streptomyces sp. NBC_01171 TaxID=2903757 RepID=UPI003864143E|nr:cytochrome d ubiquinol oxidase subunit II [Streptomyces sp. NBC_01171]